MKDDASRVPPYSQIAEKSVIGSMLRDNSVIDDVLKIMPSVAEFYFDAHQKIANAIIELRANKKPADLVTVAECLISKKQFEDVGSSPYLAELYDAAPTTAHAEYYARIVHDKAKKRGLIHVGTEMVRDAYDDRGPAEQLIGDAQKGVNALAESLSTGEPTTLVVAMAEAFARLDAKQKGAPLGVPTGYSKLDEMLCGWQKGELILLACRPSVGKTAFACNAIRNACRHGNRVLFISLEQSRIEIADRLTCIESKVDSWKLRSAKINSNDQSALNDALATMNPWRLDIDDAKGQTITRICATIRRHHRKFKIDAVFIDYVQFIEPEDRRPQRYEQIGVISRRLKNLAGELNIPVVCCAQLNRTEGDEPKLSDLRESGNLEQDADTVIFLHRPPTSNDNDEPIENEVIKVIVSKNRNGPIGKVNFNYHRPTLTFDLLEMRPIDDGQATPKPAAKPAPKSGKQREHYSDRV